MSSSKILMGAKVVPQVTLNGALYYLIVRRALHLRILPGVWEFPGGKIEQGECPLQAAFRENKEELGQRFVFTAGMTPLRLARAKQQTRNGSYNGQPSIVVEILFRIPAKALHHLCPDRNEVMAWDLIPARTLLRINDRFRWKGQPMAPYAANAVRRFGAETLLTPARVIASPPGFS